MTSRLRLKKKRWKSGNEETGNDLKSNKIFERAIANARKHNINLKPGIENKGDGNCSYEAVLLNINNRNCFHTKFLMSLGHYRVVWTTDIMNKTLDGRIEWNPGLSRSEIVQGFEELMESGVYERDFFGDMMMASIACGVRKIILIFHTNEDISRTGHDPVSVIDPRDYGGYIDSETPVVVAYNLVHYESLEPLCDDDINGTVKLVRSYIAKPSKYMEDYGFTGQDISYLISQSESKLKCSLDPMGSPGGKQKKDFEETKSESLDASPKTNDNTEDIAGFIYEDILFKETGDRKVICGVCQVDCKKLIVHTNGNEYCTEYFSNMEDFKIEYSRYRHNNKKKGIAKDEKLDVLKDNAGSKQETNDLKNKTNQTARVAGLKHEKGFEYEGVHFEELEQNKVRCGICMVQCSRLIVHMNRNKECTQRFSNMPDFKIEYSKYRNRKRKRENEARKKAEDVEAFNENGNKRKRAYEAKKKAEDPQGFCEKANKSKRVYDAKKKAEDLQGFNEKANKSKRAYDAKKKVEDPIGFNKRANERKRRYDAKKKAEDPEGFNEMVKKSKKEYEEKKRDEDLQGFNEKANKRKRAYDEKKKEEDPEEFKENLRKRKQKSDNAVRASQRLAKFKRRIRYGPIFVCSCCHQKLFENQVHVLSDELRKIIDEGNPGIREELIDEEILVEIGREKFAYLCKSCIGYLKKGKIPKLCVKNGLHVDKIDNNLRLTELENNLIARNIVFQKIHKMPKSRWSGTHDRLVNVPVNPEDVLNTVENLPRTPAEAGLIPIIPVNLKRKLEYKTTHLTQMIDTNKIFRYLDYLRKMGHPGYKFFDDRNTYEKRCLTEDAKGALLVFPEEENEIVDLDMYKEELARLDGAKTDEPNSDNHEVYEIEEEEYVTKDPVRKYQYEYNRTTCMTNKFPEPNQSQH